MNRIVFEANNGDVIWLEDGKEFNVTELVERAKPMKPSDEMTGGLMCDKCFNCTVTEDMNFCSNCGQAIEHIAKESTL